MIVYGQVWKLHQILYQKVALFSRFCVLGVENLRSTKEQLKLKEMNMRMLWSFQFQFCMKVGVTCKRLEPLTRIELVIFPLQGECVNHCATKATADDGVRVALYEHIINACKSELLKMVQT